MNDTTTISRHTCASSEGQVRFTRAEEARREVRTVGLADRARRVPRRLVGGRPQRRWSLRARLRSKSRRTALPQGHHTCRGLHTHCAVILLDEPCDVPRAMKLPSHSRPVWRSVSRLPAHRCSPPRRMRDARRGPGNTHAVRAPTMTSPEIQARQRRTDAGVGGRVTWPYLNSLTDDCRPRKRDDPDRSCRQAAGGLFRVNVQCPMLLHHIEHLALNIEH